VVLGAGSGLYAPVIFGLSEYFLVLDAVSWRASLKFGPGCRSW